MRKTELCRNAQKKLRSAGGFTLVELIVVVVIVTIAGGVIAATVDLAVGHYDRLMQQSDAQLLCSSVSLFVQKELTYAGNVQVAGDSVTFTDHANDLGKGCVLAAADGKIKVSYSGGSFSPIGDGAYGGARKQLTVDSAFEEKENDCVEVVIKVNGKSGATLAENTFRVKPVAP
ncbi:MAG: prepilin-type N-terminal cleavage/methylation domain-containing protein [Oscillospiraceae bacterium]|nr:prepilin-type N-terminal cleavage/methylation domain-containing protein [Oscillospiraceae bacterium]